ncbi:MAG: hypothetical protein JWO00_28 [Candidatus Parcubacteria bacterium]|nr:hypothetical protein [Candidatus Parcubacteria bacterium]
MKKDILNRLLVVIVLGYERLTEVLCADLPDQNPVYLIPIRTLKAENRQPGRRDTSPLHIFMEEAEKAVQARKPIVVMTGFPCTYPDACDIDNLCPHLLTLSLEQSPSMTFHEASKHFFDGMTRQEFKRHQERAANELKGIKHILNRGGEMPIINGELSLTKQRRYLSNRILEFKQGTEISLTARSTPQITRQDTRELVPA